MKKADKGARNLRHAEELILFEQWMRFYFIEEDGGILYIRMPQSVVDMIRHEYPALFPMVEALNDHPIDHQATLAILSESMLNGDYALNSEEWAEVLGGSGFKLTLTLLSTWVEAEEDSLDAEQLSFSSWLVRFEAWCASEAILDYAARLRDQIEQGGAGMEYGMDTGTSPRMQ